MRDELVTFIRRRGDEALAVALATALLIEILLRGGSIEGRLAWAAAAVTLGVAAARRVRAPLLLLGFMFAVTAAEATLPKRLDTAGGQAVGLLVLFLAVYSAAAHTGGRRTLVAGGMTCAMAVTNLVVDPAGITAEGVVFYALIFGAPWVAGRAVRRRRLSEGLLEKEHAKAEAVIAEERARIARELHDVVAHSISIMVLQARGGRRALEAEPADAREAFSTIERTGRQALDEMRRLLGMLRGSDEAIALAPQPSLRELDGLVEQMQAAGLPVQVAIEGEARELPSSVDLSAYRIAQEALTNALKHAGPARARILLRYGADDLELEITDDGPGTGDGTGPGYGLVGMRERVSVYGGELQAGRRPGGGYALRVRLPLGSART